MNTRPEIPVTAVRITPAKVIKHGLYGYCQPAIYTAAGVEYETHISARLKRDLPRALETKQKHINLGNLKVILNNGRIEMEICSYNLF